MWWRMSFEEPTLEDVIEYFHSTALEEKDYSMVYINKLRNLVEDLATTQYELIPYYDNKEKLFD